MDAGVFDQGESRAENGVGEMLYASVKITKGKFF